jgi:valyl-tRNA synthetase
VKAIILGARQIRGQLDVPRSRQMPIFIKAPGDAQWQIIVANTSLIRFLANVTDITPLTDEGKLPPTAMQLIEGYAVHAPLASLIDDPDVELARLAKRKAKVGQELARSEAKLGNEKFAANAPAEVVEQERARIAAFRHEIAQIEEQEQRVRELKK